MKHSIQAVLCGVILSGCVRATCCDRPDIPRGEAGRWAVAYKPYADGHKDGTILLDTTTGRTWFFDMTQTKWWEIERGVVPAKVVTVDSGEPFPPGHVPPPPNR